MGDTPSCFFGAGAAPPDAAGCYGPSAQGKLFVKPLADEANPRSPRETARWEAGLLAVSRRWFAAVLAREHPIYAAQPRTTLAELAAMITGHLA